MFLRLIQHNTSKYFQIRRDIISLWQARVVLLGRTIAFYQVFFTAGEGGFGQMMYRSLEQSPQESRDGYYFVQCPGLVFLAARWSGPAASASIVSVSLDYILRVCQSLWASFLYLGKLHWFLYLLLSYFHDPGMFIFRWSSWNFVEKVVLNESLSAKMASRVSHLVYYYCI